MPTIPRRPAAQHERERLQARRLGAAELFTIGVRQAEIARQLDVSRQAVSGRVSILSGRADQNSPAWRALRPMWSSRRLSPEAAGVMVAP
jgi:hypothetical protein